MATLVTLERVKQALRIDHSDDDTLLEEVYIPAASGAVVRHLKSQADEIIPADGEAPEAIQVATILLIGHWYDPAEPRQDFEGNELPSSVKALLKPLRDPTLA